MDHRKRRVVTQDDRRLRDMERRSAAVIERHRNLEIWAALVAWLLVFAAVQASHFATPLLASGLACVAAAAAFIAVRVIHRHD
jgi:hypothetical protein